MDCGFYPKSHSIEGLKFSLIFRLGFCFAVLFFLLLSEEGRELYDATSSLFSKGFGGQNVKDKTL